MEYHQIDYSKGNVHNVAISPAGVEADNYGI
jgi:hypothetical protein